MIYEFTFTNFRSYKNEATIDFGAKPISEFENTLLHGKEVDLLPVCVIYGPNGGGKSSVLMAIKSLQNIVVSPLTQLAFMKKKSEQLSDVSVEEVRKNISIKNEEEVFYKWDEESENNPTEYSILFEIAKNQYRYELKVKKGTILEENLYIKDSEEKFDALFERDEEGVYLCNELNGFDIENMNESLPLLSYIGMFKNIQKIDNALRFFYNIQTIDFDAPDRDRTIFVKTLEKDKTRILNVVQSMGIDIIDVRMEYDEDGRVKNIYTKHKLENEKFRELKFEEESSGTQKNFQHFARCIKWN